MGLDVKCCPTCGQQLPRDVIRGRYTTAAGEKKLYRNQQRKQHACVANRIINALAENPYGLTIYQLAAIVYEGDSSGGPDNASTCLHVRLCYMNKKWEKAGSSIRIRGHGGPGSKYQIWIVK